MGSGVLEFERWAWWPVAALVLLLGVVVVWGARRAGAGGGVRGYGLLAGVRVVVIALLAAVVVGPVWRRPPSAAERGGVAVLIDESLSTDTLDTQRTGAERLKIAEALGAGTNLPEWKDPGGPAHRRAADLLATLTARADAIVQAAEAAEAVEFTRRDPREARARVTATKAGFAWQLDTVARSDELVESAKKALAPLAAAPADTPAPAFRTLVGRAVQDARSALEADRDARLERLAREDPAAARAAAVVGTFTRTRLARAVVGAGSGDAGLLGRLRGDGADGGAVSVPVRLYAFGGDVVPLTDSDWADRLAGTASKSAAPGTAVVPTATRLSAAIARVATETTAPGDSVPRPAVRAVVVVTDGRETDGRETDGRDRTAETAIDPGAGTLAGIEGVTLFTVSLTPRSPAAGPATVRVKRLEVPERMVVGQTARARVTLRAEGFDSASAAEPRATLRFLAAGQTQVREVSFGRAGDGRPGERTAEFDISAERAGDLSVELLCEPGSGLPGPQRLRRVVRVLAEKTRVLLVTAEPTWDAQSLRTALARTPNVRLTELPVARREDLPLAFGAADVAVLAGVPARLIDREARDALRELVTRRGGGLVLLPAGGDWGWADDPELAVYLPGATAAWRSSPAAEGSYFALPTDAGTRAGLGSERDWATRPALYRLLNVGPLKPAATALLSDRGTDLPVLALTRVGPAGGASLLLATDQAWRWRAGAGGASPATGGSGGFWSDALRQVAEEPYAASLGGLSLDADVSADRLAVRVRRTDRLGRPDTDGGPPTLVLRREGRTVRELTTSPTMPGRYTARLTTGLGINGLPEGDYTLELMTPPGQESPRLTLTVGDGGEAELADLTGDPARLDRLAHTVGTAAGEAFTPTDLPELARRLREVLARPPGPGEPPDPRITVRLWDSPALLALVVSLLSLEWALRKHWGMT